MSKLETNMTIKVTSKDGHQNLTNGSQSTRPEFNHSILRPKKEFRMILILMRILMLCWSQNKDLTESMQFQELESAFQAFSYISSTYLVTAGVSTSFLIPSLRVNLLLNKKPTKTEIIILITLILEKT